jgi:sulfur-oxidizing protein SoxZ
MSNVLINAPKTARKGELVEIKALILHPMETGFRSGTNGRIIPRNIIERFTATWNGRQILDMNLSPAIAANPFVSFFAVAQESGRVVMRWSGDNGFQVEESVTIAVE